jgi:DNA helicase HerA-like ATPase
MVGELLTNHFAIVGSTGCGKSLILSEILANQPNAHVARLDPHNEYSTAFGDLAEVLNVQNAPPFWLLNLEEAVRILVRGGTQQEQKVQEIILKDAMRQSRQRYASSSEAGSWITPLACVR